MTQPRKDSRRPAGRIPNNLVVLGSAAVVAIYTAGNVQTKAAAQQFDDDSGRRPRPTSSGLAADLSPTATSDSVPAYRAHDVQPPVDTRQITRTNAPAPSAPSSPATSAVSATPAVTSATVGETSHPAPLNHLPAAASGAAGAPMDTTGGATDAKKLVAVKSPNASKLASEDTTTAIPVKPPESKPAEDGGAVKAVWRDGTYSGWGTSRHGDIEATVVIEGGRITNATISRCLTRYSCSWVNHLQQQVVDRQSADVDYVSGATQSANAFYYAVFEALQKAK